MMLKKKSVSIPESRWWMNAAVVMQKKIPFEVQAPQQSDLATGLEAFRRIRKMAENGQLPDMTLDEINEEIRLAREERRQRK